MINENCPKVYGPFPGNEFKKVVPINNNAVFTNTKTNPDPLNKNYDLINQLFFQYLKQIYKKNRYNKK